MLPAIDASMHAIVSPPVVVGRLIPNSFSIAAAIPGFSFGATPIVPIP